MKQVQDNFKRFQTPEQWQKMREEAKRFWYMDDLDTFAVEHYKRWPYTPLDPFDIILWDTPEQKRFYNENSNKHARANKAVAPKGMITRLDSTLIKPTFYTLSLTELGFSDDDANSRNYQNRELITEIKEVLEQAVTGSAWYSIEVSRKSLIHPHVYTGHDALSVVAYSEPIYNPRNLYKYLIKGTPYNAENLATYFKGKKLLREEKRKQLVRKTGRIRVSNSIQA